MPSVSTTKRLSSATSTTSSKLAPRPYILPSATDDWATPQATFDALDEEFDFDLDPCASRNNHKCARYFTKKQNGLARDWGTATVFCNPPYGRVIATWMAKAEDACAKGATVVMLVPARTDTKWFHDIALLQEVRFLRGRLKFGGSKNAAPFGCIVVVFRPKA
jgi:phage N-6-adenine-methyltransferase